MISLTCLLFSNILYLQQNTMGMGTMGMMAQQAQLNAANAAKMSQFQVCYLLFLFSFLL